MRGDVRFGSLADICAATRHVCFTPIATAKADIGRKLRPIMMISASEVSFLSQIAVNRSNEKATAYLTSTRVRASALRLSARGACAVR
jgi:hypothetical protein